MKHIQLDSSMKTEIIKKFTEYVNGLNRYTANSINFNETINNKITDFKRPVVYISGSAYLKMLLYVRDTSTEIAWHGVVERNIDKNYYHIKDVFLYPQVIGSVTVDTNQEEYQNWLNNIEDDEVYNNIRFQGHSHVNMGVSPSGTDMNMYEDFLQILPKDDYYIFAIMNKSGDITMLIYDLAKNIMYETSDIDIKILGNNTYNILDDIKKDKEQYCKTRQYTNTATISGYSNYKDYHDDYLDYIQSKTITPKAKSKKTDVNDLLDEIDKKYRNPIINTKKKK